MTTNTQIHDRSLWLEQTVQQNVAALNSFEWHKAHFFLYDSAINIRIISYLLTKKRKEREGEGKEREKSFLFCLYDSAINIDVFMLGN
jgi:hypothetical protein